MLYLPSEFPLENDIQYLNHAAVAPWPRRTAEAVQRFAFQNMREGATHYPDWMHVMNDLREKLSRLIGADHPKDIALVKNTSEGLSIVAGGLDWQPGDRIVGIADDFPSNRVVWEALREQGVHFHGVDINAADDPEQALIDALLPGTRLLAVSSVHFATGLRLDVKRLAEACRDRDILVCLDAIQSVGAIGFDLADIPVDFVTADGHKWMLGPEGIGFFWCRPALRENLRLHQFGWAMLEHIGDYDRKDWAPAHNARRFEAGSPNMLGIHALNASIGLLLEVGMDTVESRVLANARWLMEAVASLPGAHIVTPRDDGRHAGILSFGFPDRDLGKLYQALMQAGVICAYRGGNLRFSPHFYTPESVMERAVSQLSNLI